MKTRYVLITSVIISCLMSGGTWAQNDIRLDLRHMLAGEDFALEKEASTPEGVRFNTGRLEYYVSEISVTHDGGQVTPFNDLWLLVNASEDGLIDLGAASIASVESIAFSVGVDEEHNHLDPASWPVDHPLAPKRPSMHWGWISGYRFVAMEGMGGPQLNQVYEVHALDNINYFETSVDASAEAQNGEVIITVYADYTQALKGIDVSAGVITHGSAAEAATMLENFRDHVFSAEAPSGPALGVADTENKLRVTAAPNPSEGGVVRLLTDHRASNGLVIEAFDITGKQADFSRSNQTGVIELSGLEAGLYVVRITDERSGTQETLKVTVLR